MTRPTHNLHSTAISEQAWTDINRLADNLDVMLRAEQTKMAIGCQLAFIAIKEFGTPEWTNEINGPTKKRYARSLIKRFQTRFARKGIILTHKSKEHTKKTPVWSLCLYWRGDGKPLVLQEKDQEADQKTDPEIPSDLHNPDLQRLIFFPDAGCLKVELPLSCSWRQISAYVTGLYKLAQEGGLVTEKYRDNGLSIGAGCPCPIYVGGAHPTNSPFLKNPQLLTSVVTYWNSHPSLSYLFAGYDIGPFGQAPRLDETRRDALFEVETALDHLSSNSNTMQNTAQELDQALRPFLTNLYGDTALAEICLDQFCPAGQINDQRGIIELRSFDMQSDDRSCLLLLTLVRCLMSWLQKNPQSPPFQRWRDKLHDAFTMPHALYHDFLTVLSDLENGGFSFHKNWFTPLLGRRFPKYGKVVLDDVHLELSQALEPVNHPAMRASHTHFHVLERLQLKVTGLNQERHILSCNDVILPLSPPDSDGVQMTCIRIKAREQAACCLESAPRKNRDLTFELIDKEKNTSLGGFFYNTTDILLAGPPLQTLDPTPFRKKRIEAFSPFAPYDGEVKIGSTLLYEDYQSMIDARRL